MILLMIFWAPNGSGTPLPQLCNADPPSSCILSAKVKPVLLYTVTVLGDLHCGVSSGGPYTGVFTATEVILHE